MLIEKREKISLSIKEREAVNLVLRVLEGITRESAHPECKKASLELENAIIKFITEYEIEV